MNDHEAFTNRDQEEFVECVNPEILRVGELKDIQTCLTKWRDLVRSVEFGYDFTIDDYTNELSARDAIQAVLDQASLDLKRKIARRVEPLDQRFLTHTIPSKRPLSEAPDETSFWWLRLPSRLSGDLESDAISLGYLDPK